jgi:hypothetical protein
VARSPTPHEIHSSASAAIRGASDQSRNAAPAAAPVVSGSVAHATRSAQIGMGRIIDGAFERRWDAVLMVLVVG